MKEIMYFGSPFLQKLRNKLKDKSGVLLLKIPEEKVENGTFSRK